MVKLITNNKKAFFDYFIDETYEAGIQLEGSEVKSVRLGHISLKDAYCDISNGEVFLKNANITPYEKSTLFTPDGKRDRKMLLNRSEINRLTGKIKEKGFSLIPTKAYFKDNLVKIEIGLARGKKAYDKRESIKQKDVERDIRRNMNDY